MRRYLSSSQKADVSPDWPGDSLLATRPVNLTNEQAAAIPYCGLLALDFLRKAHVWARQRALVFGASELPDRRWSNGGSDGRPGVASSCRVAVQRRRSQRSPKGRRVGSGWVTNGLIRRRAPQAGRGQVASVPRRSRPT